MTIKCPNCHKDVKRIITKKFPGEKWYYCHNPSCNMTAFERRSIEDASK